MSKENNGGKTSYYDTPNGNQTLNDLIEYKKMKPWQHEVFKACYALEERGQKINPENPLEGMLREINKMEYYIERGRNLILKQIQDKSK